MRDQVDNSIENYNIEDCNKKSHKNRHDVDNNQLIEHLHALDNEKGLKAQKETK